MFQWSRYIIRIDLNHIIISFFLLFQYLQCFLCISRCDHTIWNFPFNQHRSIFVTYIWKRNKIAKRRHSVCSSSSRICTCQWGKFFPVHVIYPIDLCQCLCKRKSYCSSCRRNMFERSCCRKSCCFLKITNQLPAVKCIQKIDITRFAGKYLDWKILSFFHIDSGRFLIWVTSVF